MWYVTSAPIGSGKTNFDQIPDAANVAVGGLHREQALAKEKVKEDPNDPKIVGAWAPMNSLTNHRDYRSSNHSRRQCPLRLQTSYWPAHGMSSLLKCNPNCRPWALGRLLKKNQALKLSCKLTSRSSRTQSKTWSTRCTSPYLTLRRHWHKSSKPK